MMWIVNQYMMKMIFRSIVLLPHLIAILAVAVLAKSQHETILADLHSKNIVLGNNFNEWCNQVHVDLAISEM